MWWELHYHVCYLLYNNNILVDDGARFCTILKVRLTNLHCLCVCVCVETLQWRVQMFGHFVTRPCFEQNTTTIFPGISKGVVLKNHFPSFFVIVAIIWNNVYLFMFMSILLSFYQRDYMSVGASNPKFSHHQWRSHQWFVAQIQVETHAPQTRIRIRCVYFTQLCSISSINHSLWQLTSCDEIIWMQLKSM